jgi:predicted ATP-dependent serine protease
MYGHNLGNNKPGKFTSFLNIQQVNKGGTFVGSNKLKHMTTGMMEIRFVDERSQDERYVVFSKNRRGHVGKQMFFDLSAAGDVNYDTERFKKSESLKELKRKEKELVKAQGLEFDKLFGLTAEEPETEA